MEKVSDMGFWKLAFRRIRYSKTMFFCCGILLLLLLGAVVVPLLSPFDYASQNVAFANQPMFSIDPLNQSIHWFGTDVLGRDIFVRIWYGTRISLTVAVAVAVIDCVIGVVYGGISGYYGGKVDMVMMRVLEIISGIPYLIVVMLLMVTLPRGLPTIILAYSLTGWTGMARLVRGQVLSLNQREFIIAARVMGASPRHMIMRHLFPNIVNIIIVNITLDIPNVIFTEAFLSMLGLGIAPPQSSWGIMANEGIVSFQTYPSQLIIPVVFISLTMLSFNLLGDRLQDVFDPLNKR